MTNPPSPRAPALIPLLILGVIAVAAASLCLGPVAIPLDRLLAALTGQGDRIAQVVLFELRLPRTLIALLVGGMLGLAGAALQGYLRNPLAEPSVLGASNASALGAVIALYFGLAEWSPLVLPALAIGGGLLALGLLFVLAGRAESPLTLILAGIAVSTLAGAGISLALNLAPNPFAAMEIMSWLMGSIENRTMTHVWIAAPCIALGAALLLVNGHALDALALGEDSARSLGVDLARTRLRLLLGVAIGVGGAVAVSGAIGFVGLIVPHVLRLLVGPEHRRLVPLSLIGGSAFVLACDLITRCVGDIRLGIVTALVGGPFFLWLLRRQT